MSQTRLWKCSVFFYSGTCFVHTEESGRLALSWRQRSDKLDQRLLASSLNESITRVFGKWVRKQVGSRVKAHFCPVRSVTNVDWHFF